MILTEPAQSSRAHAGRRAAWSPIPAPTAGCIKAAGSSHQEVIAEALGIAASRWSELPRRWRRRSPAMNQPGGLERGREPDPTDEFA